MFPVGDAGGGSSSRRSSSGGGEAHPKLSKKGSSSAVRGEVEMGSRGYEVLGSTKHVGDGFALVRTDSREVGDSDGGDDGLGIGGVDGRRLSRGLSSGEDTGEEGLLEDGRQHLSSDLRTFLNLLISFIGAGVLGLPYGFMQGGLMLSTTVICAVGVACTYCIWMLIRCKYRVVAMRRNAMLGKEKRVEDVQNPVTYSDVCQAALGRGGLLAVECALVASQAGFSTAYLVFIARNLYKLFEFDKVPVVLFCLPGLMMMCMIKHLKYLAPFSLLAEVVNFTGLAVVFFDDAEFMALDHPSIRMAQWRALPFVFGVGVYCFEGMGMAIPIESSMETKGSFTRVLSLVMAIYTLLCVMSGALGYLAFGHETQDIILLNIGDTMSTLIVKISFCIGLYLTFPIMMVPVWEVLEFKWLRRQSQHYDRNRNVLRAATVGATGVVACVVPNFGLFVSLIGSSCCALLALILPTLCYSRLERDAGFPLSAWRSVLNMALLCSGIFAMVAGTVDTLHKIFAEYGNTGSGER